MKKNLFALSAIIIAFAASAFSIPATPTNDTFKYTNNSSQPNGTNEISLATYNACQDGELTICGTKWKVVAGGYSFFAEKRYDH
jgi:hypothetical protein